MAPGRRKTFRYWSLWPRITKFPPGSEVCLKGKNDVKITGRVLWLEYVDRWISWFIWVWCFCRWPTVLRTKLQQNLGKTSKVDSLALLLNNYCWSLIMMFSLGSWFGVSLLFADLFILLLLPMKSWSTWDVWNWFSRTTYHSQLLQKCPLPQTFRWLGIQKIHPSKRRWRHGKKRSISSWRYLPPAKSIYIKYQISIKSYIGWFSMGPC